MSPRKLKAITAYAPVGSKFVGAPDPKDEDFLILSYNRKITIEYFSKKGYEPSLPTEYNQSFVSMRKGIINLIIVTNFAEFCGFLIAAVLCRKYKVFDKNERVLVHEAFRHRKFNAVDFSVDNETGLVGTIEIKKHAPMPPGKEEEAPL